MDQEEALTLVADEFGCLVFGPAVVAGGHIVRNAIGTQRVLSVRDDRSFGATESRTGTGSSAVRGTVRDGSGIHLSVGGASSHSMKRTKLIAIVAIAAIAFIALRRSRSTDEPEETVDRID